MVRYFTGLMITSMALSACQQTKLGTASPKSVNAQAAPAPAPRPGYPVPGPVGQVPPPGPQGPVNPPPGPTYNPPNYNPPPPPQPVQPSQPVQPTPVTPTTPVTPVTPPGPTPTYTPPSNPVVPTNEQVPVNPPTTQNPVTPVFQPPSIREPETVLPPQQPVQPVQPVQPTQPVQPVQPVQPITPVQQPPITPAPVVPQTPVVQNPPLPPVRPQGLGVKPAPAPSANVPLPPVRPKDLGQQPQPEKPVPLPPVRPKDLGKPAEPTCGNGLDCKPNESIAAQCGPMKLDSVEKIEQAKLDVLFVVDTSASLRGGSVRGTKGELEQIASQMEAFVNNFPENTDINIGVMLGHGHGQWTGKLFKTSAGEAAVLKSKEIRRREDLIRRLEAKMKNVPNESGGAQGEALLYSLFQSVNVAANRKAATDQGMFRSDASLAVIMVTDEQDVCFDYADPANVDPKTGKAYVPHGKKDKQGNPIPDPVEVKFFKDVCSKAYKGGLLKPEHVHDALLRLKGENQKLVLMGMVYTSNDITPAGTVTNAREDENEMGHGIIQFVDREKGKLVDLGAVQEGPTKFRDELKFLGDYTKSEISSNGNVSCDPLTQGQPAVHPLSANLDSLKVELLGADGQVLHTFSIGQGLRPTVGKIGGKQVLQAFLEAKTLNRLLNQHKAKDAKVLFKYTTRTDRDAKTGAAVDPQTSQPAKAQAARRR